MPSRCPHCEVEIEEAARFCGACGRPITATAISQRAAAALPKYSPAAATIKVSPQEPGAPRPADPSRAAGSLSGAAIPFQSVPAAATIVSSTPSIAPVTSAPLGSARRRPLRPAGRRRAAGSPAAGEPDRQDANHRFRRRGQGGRRGLRRGLPGQTDRHRARGGAEDPSSSQRLRRDDRRPLPPRGRGLLEAPRSAHRHHLRLRRDPRRDPLPGDGAPARAEPPPGAEGRGAARLRAGAEDSRSGRGVTGRGARKRHRSPRHEAGERLHRVARRARTT